MKPGDTVYTEVPNPKKSKPALKCRCTILEIQAGVARCSCWDGKRIFNHNAMTKDLREKP